MAEVRREFAGAAEAMSGDQDLNDRMARVLAAIAAGKPVLVADAANREDEVDAIMAARNASPEWVAWLIRYSSGYICAPMPAERADALELPVMVPDNQDPLRTAYTVSVDATRGVGTGISAADRARTAQVLADPTSRPTDLIRPGHVLPLRARSGGVLERAGHTEAAVDLVRLAGAGSVGLIAELVEDDGRMMRASQAREFARREGLEFLTVAELAAWLRTHPAAVSQISEDGFSHNVEPHRVVQVGEADLPTKFGAFRVHAFREVASGLEHVALVAPPPGGTHVGDVNHAPLVRVHSECLTGDAFGSLRCDCGPQLQTAMQAVARHGGAVLYLRGQEGRGIGIGAKVAAYALQDAGRDTVEANEELGLPVDSRDYRVAANMLRELGFERVRLMTNNPRKATALHEAGIDVTDRVPITVGVNPTNMPYLLTKKRSMGHLLDLPEEK